VVTITVNAVNDAPVLGNNAFTINDGTSLGLTGGNLSATDVDDAAAGLVFDITGITHGYFQLAASPGVAITTFTQAQVAAGQVQFVHDGSGFAPTFMIAVTDGAAGVGPFTANITFNGGGAPGPTAPPSGGGGGTTTPPVVPPPVVTPAPTPTTTTTPGPTGQTFVRSPSSPAAPGGDAGGENAPATTPEAPPSVAAVLAQTFVAETQMPSVRIQSQTVDTQSVRAEIEVEPIRAEMQVLPISQATADPEDEEKRKVEVIMGTVKITGLALSVGAVWWAARAAGIIASLVASAPAWRHLDPLPVLGRDEEEEGELTGDAGDEDAEDDEGRNEEHRARWVLESN
jgi:hypothetical protein